MNEQPENPATIKARCVNCGDVQLAREMYCSKAVNSGMSVDKYACVDSVACRKRQDKLPFPDPGPPKDRPRRERIERTLRLHDPIIHHALRLIETGQVDYVGALEIMVCELERFPPAMPVADIAEIQKRINEMTENVADHMEKSSTIPERDRK